MTMRRLLIKWYNVMKRKKTDKMEKEEFMRVLQQAWDRRSEQLERYGQFTDEEMRELYRKACAAPPVSVPLPGRRRSPVPLAAVVVAVVLLLSVLLFPLTGGRTGGMADGPSVARQVLAVGGSPWAVGQPPAAMPARRVSPAPSIAASPAGSLPVAMPDAAGHATVPAELSVQPAVPVDSIGLPPTDGASEELFAAIYCSGAPCDTQHYLYQIKLDFNLI